MFRAGTTPAGEEVSATPWTHRSRTHRSRTHRSRTPPEQGYPVSELAEAFRGPTPLEYKTLKDDIDLNGQQVPIAFKDGKIVDGRQRKRACIELGITPRYEELPDDIDPARFLMAMHRKYRDLSKNDLALAASQLSAWSRPGGGRKSERLPTPPGPFRTCA